ncbi:hypothetical protein HY085_01315 [Candidatus Gottesmanbacteria bacterium]|nr:hypothetical protein [Candidatus Gottesmanbacteria bacterium]
MDLVYNKSVTLEIDQSGKVEYTSEHTVLADSSGHSILLKAVDKRNLQKIFRLAGKPNAFVYQTFTALLVLLMESHKEQLKECIFVIDGEYPGWEEKIRSGIILISLKKNLNLSPEQIRLGLIGKKTPAHGNAYNVFKKKRKADKIIKLQEVLKIIV